MQKIHFLYSDQGLALDCGMDKNGHPLISRVVDAAALCFLWRPLREMAYVPLAVRVPPCRKEAPRCSPLLS
jgi:hypothetical protein